MIRHQRTVVALSATETDRPLVEYARKLAELGFARHYYFVHVCTPARIADETRTPSEIHQYCEEMVEGTFANANERATASCHIVEGIRVDALIEFIEEQSCDMVLLGHRKARSGQRSLSRRLAMIAPCSVWLVPEGAPVSISKITVPIDFSDHSADSLTVATVIASAAGVPKCRATHVFSDPSIIRYDERIDEIRQNDLKAFETFIQEIDRHGVQVCPEFVEGNKVAGTILYAAERYGADLLVMNTRGRSRSASILLGSVTSQVISESPVAVLAVKHYGAMMNLFDALRKSQVWARQNPKTN